ncbi:hypothetical protein [Rhodococcus sp. MEB041]|uniref:hypothetical protein n=1 Tax=Rhodococcus sp. MEB041 TaxID=3040323 RepID=UPI00254B457D|nr:hypothetical protein [Rhodococcus sp. MEB041]
MASELAVAYVSILPETSRLVPEFNRQVGPGIERSGREQGQRYGNAFSGSAGKLIGAASGLVAGAAIVGFVNESIKSLQRIERINTQTETVIASTGNAAKVSAGHVEDLAGELENLTATEAETIQQGANFLLTFKNIRNEVGAGNDIFDQTVGVMTDLSRATGTDMKAASLQLGKALNDPIKGISALARVGITFSADQKKQIEGFVEVNDILSAQKIVLGELESQFGGSAEAYANTTEGKIELAKHALGTFGEAVTAQVLPPLAAVGTATAAAFNGLAEHSDEVLAVAGAFVAWKFIPPLLAQTSAALTGAAARVGAFATATAYAQTAAGRTQASVGRLSAAMFVLSQQGGNVGRIGTAFTTASAGATRFATTAGAAAAAGKALQIAGGGIVSALGGPFGIAVLAAGAALFFWVKKNQEAKAAAEANEAAIKAISDTLDAQTGAVTDATIAAQAKILADNGMTESARNYGIKAGDIVAAHLNQEGALERVNGVLDDNVRKSVEASNAYQGYGKTLGLSSQQIAGALRGNQADIDAYYSAISRLTVTGDEGFPTLDEFRKQLDQAGQGALDLGTSIGTTNDQLTEAEAIQRDTALAMDQGGESASAFAEQIDVLSDSASSAEDRTNALKQALDALNGNPLDLEQANSQLQDAFQTTGEAVKPKEGEAAPSVNLDTNTIDVATEAGRRFLDVTVAQRDATLDAARAARDAAIANGDLSGAQQAATAVVEQSRQKFIEQVGQLGITGDAAQKLADKYIGIPSVVSTLIDQPNMAEKQLALDILKSKVDLVPNDKAITVETLDADAKARLEALGFTVTTLPDGKVEITANTAIAQDAINEIIKPKTVPVSLQVLNPREVSEQIDAATAATGRRVNRGEFAANGAVFDFYANGGTREDHVAQIAPAGSWRVWGEPETGGEGYIPLAPAKRARSVTILSEIAQRFGMRLEKFADGGVVEAMRGIIAKRFPALQLTSGYRDEPGSYHGTGQAADFSNGSGNTAEQLAGANFVADNFPDSAELIYDDPGFDRQIKDGSIVDRGFYAGAGNHTNHFHWAMLNAPTDPDSAAAQNAAGTQLSERDRIVDTILSTGRARGFTDREIKSAVMAGLAESDLQNLDYGDRDSQGYLQQRPSQGWGTVEQVRDIDYATGKYYDALGKVADRDKMTEAQMAQAVQRSAFSDGSNYQAKADEAQALIDAANARTTTSPVSTPESAADPASPAADSTSVAASSTGPTPETFSIKGRVQQLGSDLAGVAFDALTEQIPFGLGQSRWLTTDYPTFARKDIRIEEFDPEPPKGTPEHDEWMRRREGGKVPVFDSGGIVRPGINIIDNQTGANEALANVTGLLTADPAPAGGVDNSLNIAKIEGANADEIIRRITQLQTRQHMRSSNRPF